MRLVHSSDLHIGVMESAPRIESLLQVVGISAAVEGDVIVLAGDVFDHTGVSSRILDRCAQILGDAEVPTVILPGNHDCLIDGRYMRGAFDDLPSTYIVGYPGQEETLSLDGLGTFWGRPHYEHQPLKPFADLPPSLSGDGSLIGLGHGHLVRREQDLSDWYYFELEELRDHPFAYVALGHWDHYYPVSEELRIYYSGAPHYAQSVNVVDLQPGEAPLVRRTPIRPD